ncbi:unnamed protein product [Clavelina lepadiformis]|uniref:WD repeat-containing protein 37 n=1 Tax=Clavelina lepadiformis TaxID=159417 RepID=A0ABP0GC61_CLALP
MESIAGKKEEKKHLTFLRSNSKDRDIDALPNNQRSNSTVLPCRIRTRLHDLFEQIETEFGVVYSENMELRKTISALNEKLSSLDSGQMQSEKAETTNSNGSEIQKSMKNKSGSSQLSQKLKTTYKTGTSKLVSSFKASANVVCRAIQEFQGHKDGIWDVASSQVNTDIIGSASADQKAKLWSLSSGDCIGTYHGHAGSVNCIRFHPDKYIALTASGDSTAHIWTYEATRLSSCDEDSADREDSDDNGNAEAHDYRSPLMSATCHTSPVVCCDWLMDGLHFVTASWDRTACLVDSTTSQIIQTLSGHDLPLTHVSAHSKHKMIVTSSRDATFRVCDFREPTIHTVIVGQGHSQSVSSAVFTDDDKVGMGVQVFFTHVGAFCA